MATPVIRNLKLVYSLYGRNVNEKRTIDILFRTKAETTNDNIRDLHAAVLAQFKTILPAQVQFIRATSSLARRAKTAHIQRGNQIPQKVAIAGTKANGDGLDLADGDYVALFEKTADGGNAGLIQVRGSFLQGEVVSVEGSPQLKAGFTTAPYTALALALVDIFTDNHVEMILPAKAADNFVSGARPVADIKFIGVGKRQQLIVRRSVTQNKKAYANGTLRDIADRIYNLTHNPDGSINVLSAALIGAFVAELAPLVADVGIAYLAGLPVWAELPEVVQAGLLALGAAGA